MGEWLHLNGEAIYGSRPFTGFGEGPTKGGTKSVEMKDDIQTYTAEDIRFTTNRSASGKSVLYATLLVWPKDGDIIIHSLFAENPYLLEPVCGVELVGSNDSLQFHQSQAGRSSRPGDIAYVLRIHSSCKEHGQIASHRKKAARCSLEVASCWIKAGRILKSEAYSKKKCASQALISRLKKTFS